MYYVLREVPGMKLRQLHYKWLLSVPLLDLLEANLSTLQEIQFSRPPTRRDEFMAVAQLLSRATQLQVLKLNDCQAAGSTVVVELVRSCGKSLKTLEIRQHTMIRPMGNHSLFPVDGPEDWNHGASSPPQQESSMEIQGSEAQASQPCPRCRTASQKVLVGSLNDMVDSFDTADVTEATSTQGPAVPIAVPTAVPTAVQIDADLESRMDLALKQVSATCTRLSRLCLHHLTWLTDQALTGFRPCSEARSTMWHGLKEIELLESYYGSQVTVEGLLDVCGPNLEMLVLDRKSCWRTRTRSCLREQRIPVGLCSVCLEHEKAERAMAVSTGDQLICGLMRKLVHGRGIRRLDTLVLIEHWVTIGVLKGALEHWYMTMRTLSLRLYRCSHEDLIDALLTSATALETLTLGLGWVNVDDAEVSQLARDISDEQYQQPMRKHDHEQHQQQGPLSVPLSIGGILQMPELSTPSDQLGRYVLSEECLGQYGHLVQRLYASWLTPLALLRVSTFCLNLQVVKLSETRIPMRVFQVMLRALGVVKQLVLDMPMEEFADEDDEQEGAHLDAEGCGKKDGRLTLVKAHGPDENAFLKSIEICLPSGRLEHLELTFQTSVRIPVKALYAVMQKHRALRTVKLVDVDIEESVSPITKVGKDKRGHDKGANRKDKGLLGGGRSGTPDATCGVSDFNTRSLDIVVNSLTELFSISLSSCKRLSSEGLIRFFGSTTQRLVHIHLCDMNAIHDATLDMVAARHAPTLRKMAIYFCAFVTDKGIKRLLATCEELRVLGLQAYGMSTNIFEQDWACQDKLEQLDLQGVFKLYVQSSEGEARNGTPCRVGDQGNMNMGDFSATRVWRDRQARLDAFEATRHRLMTLSSLRNLRLSAGGIGKEVLAGFGLEQRIEVLHLYGLQSNQVHTLQWSTIKSRYPFLKQIYCGVIGVMKQDIKDDLSRLNVELLTSSSIPDLAFENNFDDQALL
ncbi:hypothetical protein EDD11_009885 [Mortierella claussenii]|nr:hypothetical protein EDD11_009885 [Mortierella claussenii]